MLEQSGQEGVNAGAGSSEEEPEQASCGGVPVGPAGRESSHTMREGDVRSCWPPLTDAADGGCDRVPCGETENRPTASEERFKQGLCQHGFGPSTALGLGKQHLETIQDCHVRRLHWLSISVRGTSKGSKVRASFRKRSQLQASLPSSCKVKIWNMTQQSIDFPLLAGGQHPPKREQKLFVSGGYGSRRTGRPNTTNKHVTTKSPSVSFKDGPLIEELGR
ncbi:hypothetical protein JZ751_013318 [Albula glossodonta]|uniref:Uncharacterized protein n=1 Tax=Albula glossodonta TaxID=121402 RepID=A0A8T2NX86_9TELE|nr:hypothetical protein JZ751_013318 [Albula glossodonta]